ncbi:metallophosphoesterase family protein [Nitrosophilus kaiyonis]|uniref:metallophosphoesterase family protein n=1 Tax=Nitrosophilus kaiyonis TaxID=2930200 RepID=UPI0024934F01|nr:metallophosphoesterase family protein [Nitrosophilus kaiyonis]
MKIGIISDTHNRVDLTKEAINKLIEFNISYLIHAGDIGKDVANFLDSLDIKTVAVLGNTDTNIQKEHKNLNIQTQPYYFKIKDTTFKLMHQPYFLTPDSDVIIYGHLHKFECSKQKSLYINPGEVCAREKPKIECALLYLDGFEVNYIHKDLEKELWIEKKVC